MCVVRQRVVGHLARSFDALELGGNASCHRNFSASFCVFIELEPEHACNPTESFDSHDVDLVASFPAYHIQNRRDSPPHRSWRHDRQCRQ